MLKNKKTGKDDSADATPPDSLSAKSSVVSPPVIPNSKDTSQQTRHDFELLPENLLSLSKLSADDLSSLGISLTSLPTSNTVEPPTQSEVCETQLVRVLTTEEDRQLKELLHVYNLSFTVDLEPLVHINKLDPSLNQLINQSSITILRLIKFAKRLEEFAHLPQSCQIGVLKGCWIHILILRSVSVYDAERDVWVTPRGDIPTEILKNATGFVRLHDDHARYCKSIKSIIGDDLVVVILLLAIVLFSPEGLHVVMRQLISDMQDRYLVLLKHYLEAKYGYVQSAEMFPQLMTKIKELKDFAEVHGRCLVDINPREIEPIMLEILDLK